MNKKELKSELDKMGIEYPEDIKKDDLVIMYEEAKEQVEDTEIDDDEVVEDDEIIKVKEEGRSKNATHIQCMRQLHGKKPFEIEESEEIEED